MLASDLLTLGAAIFGLLTSIAGSSACFYNSLRTNRINLSILKVRAHNLENLVEAVQQKLNGINVLKPDPSPWIDEAIDFLGKLNIPNLENRLDENCINGRVPNLWYQCGAGRSIEMHIQVLDVILENGKRISQGIKIKGSKQPEVHIAGNARENLRQKIWEQVSQGGASATICIHGIAGVGKTALAAAIHNKALVELTDFESVIWVSVDYGTGLKHIQEELASKLHVDLSGSIDNMERSKSLRSALQQKGKFLLVLDSLWQVFSPHDIGIPEPVGGSKLIVTSRTHSLCRKITRRFRSREIYEMEPLSQVEAWELFKAEVGHNLSQLETETRCMAKLAVQELDGLPLAVKMLAEFLSDIHDDHPSRIDAAWKEELLELSRSSSFLGTKSQEFLDTFKYSYENLADITISAFIYCALFPKGYLIKAKDLIEYWMWEGLLGEILTLEESRRYGRKTLNELRDAHLLTCINDAGREDSVMMLNIVRHVAIDTIANLGHHFFIKAGIKIKEMPLGNTWPTDTERASFAQNELSALRNGPNCKKLSTLLLQGNPLSLKHHENFFSKIRSLKVLDLSQTGISYLPSSLSGLTNLHALLLRSCPNLKHLPSLSSLQKLIVVDLAGSPLQKVPEGLQNLTKLRRLDLSQALMDTFPTNVVGKLTQVEELLLITADNGGYVWGSKEIFPQWPGACVEELVDLKRLVVLQLTFLNAKVFNTYVRKTEEQCTSAPCNFKLCVGGFYSGASVGDNSITVIGSCNIKLPEKTSELHLMFYSQEISSLKFEGCLRNLTVVDVSDFDKLTFLFSMEMLSSLRSLKNICVKRCDNMVSIIQPATEANPSSITVPELMTVMLFNLPSLKSICQAEVLNCPSLRGIEVWNCAELKFPAILLGRKSGIVEIKGEAEWLEKVKVDTPSSNSIFKFTETSVPAELSSTPCFRLRRQESFVTPNQTYSGGKFGFPLGFPSISLTNPISRIGTSKPPLADNVQTGDPPTTGSASLSTITKFVMRVRGLGSQSGSSLHSASSKSDGEDNGSQQAESGPSETFHGDRQLSL